MTLGFYGDYNEETIELPNGWSVLIEHGSNYPEEFYKGETRLKAPDRRITLYDENKKVIGVKIEENPNLLSRLNPEANKGRFVDNDEDILL
ncbi:hypothetical protein [Methanobrevibacter filiformis]|uniref:Uncharacterized protein n=1 Tax=Methanobrevibacter filiformis TaxID=55758 RepID=A0A166FA87_9EURY|nr:hypothetical protein [Methanobrevibacter filiformis]KZX17460.1 hypothetical protein MBFIL_01180 [Methanobrevibacter filiformis]